MARVEIGIKPGMKGWDGRTGAPVAPFVAHVLKARGIEVFKRTVDPSFTHVPVDWVRQADEMTLRGLDEDGEVVEEAAHWAWYAPPALAILARHPAPCDDWFMVLLWAVDHVGVPALDALLRLSENSAAYLDQVRAMCSSGFYERKSDEPSKD